MKRRVLSILIHSEVMLNVCLAAFLGSAALAGAGRPAAERPAFPGAEGFGARTPGGRHGKVVTVTTLADSGPGSLRAAVQRRGRRSVVFRVAGIIDLKSPISVTEPYLTVDGQNAPGDGVCLRGYTFDIRTHDVVVRYLRVRPGDISGREVDGINIGHGARNVIVDHCSATWSVDEALSLAGDAADITVQWCLIAEALNHSVHSKGEHGYGSLARANGNVSLHHNLWAHNTARNPRLGDNYGRPPYPVFDVRNNVIYDYGGTCTGLTQGVLKVNYVANYIKPGPSSRARTPITMGLPSEAVFHLDGNVFEGRPGLAGEAMFNRVTDETGKRIVTLRQTPFAAPPVTTTSAEAAFKQVLESVGASLPVRDAVDARVVREVLNGAGSLVDSPQQVGGWPEYRVNPPNSRRKRP